MSDFFYDIHFFTLFNVYGREFTHFLLLFFPFVFIIELPFYLIIFIAILAVYLREVFSPKTFLPFYPNVSCCLVCYNEGDEIIPTLKSLVEQIYPGNIEILVLIDGAKQNQKTVLAARKFTQSYRKKDKRYIKIIAKQSRGGRTSSLNLGLKLAKGEILIHLDGDCSCDNNMIAIATQNFTEKNIIGVSGTLRVRNARESLVTRLQAIEYMLGIHLFRIGLAKLNTVNNVSGAFGIYRTNFLRKIGGWNSATAEDLELTTRIKSYFRRYPQLRIGHDHHAIVHTDVPNSWKGLLIQRLRWDGDLFYVYCFRHWQNFSPKILGWRNFIALAWYGLLMQLCLPFLIILSSVYLFIRFNASFVFSLFIIIYGYYFILSCLSFTIYMLLVSERKSSDITFIFLLPLMPIYQIILRLWSAVAIISEVLLKSHRDSNMAPAWVNRKAR